MSKELIARLRAVADASLPYSVREPAREAAAALERAEERIACPIGMDEHRELCSAGSCYDCLRSRLPDAIARAEAAEERIAKAEAERGALRALLREADAALTEAEAILGGEYGDHYGVLCSRMLTLREGIRALRERDVAKPPPCGCRELEICGDCPPGRIREVYRKARAKHAAIAQWEQTPAAHTKG